MWRLRKLESPFEDVRGAGENQEWLGTPVTCEVPLSTNRDHRMLSIKGLYFFC